MAGWGTGSFENDDAQSWLPQLASLSIEDLQPLLARAADNADYLEAPAASVAIAAAEAIAALQGKPSQALPKEIADWARKTKSEIDSIPGLASLALRAIQRVRTNSELKDLWLEADGLNEWSANLRDLEKRLAG
jgi:3-oxoacyl-ACP reductase-like protein